VGPELAAPFADRARLGFFPSLLETLKLVALRPAEFFRRVRVDQTGSAVLLGTITGTVGSILATLYQLASRSTILQQLREPPSGAPPEALKFYEQMASTMELLLSDTAILVQVALAPLFALLGIYLMAGLVHLALLLFRGAPRGFQATLTVVGYAHGLFLLLALPSCGGLVALVWSLVATIIGVGEAQRCGPGKAAAAVFSPLVLFCLCACAIGVAVAVGMVGAMGGHVPSTTNL
jgi:hypothetical protein